MVNYDVMNCLGWFDEVFNFPNLGKRTYWKKDIDNGEVMIINIAGFKKDDIKINSKSEYNKDYLYITGTPNKNIDFIEKFNIRIELKPGISGINVKVEDGLLYIEMIKEKIKPRFKIQF